MPPRISVIVPIYNAASTLRAAVQSILTQDIAGLEVLLVDEVYQTVANEAPPAFATIWPCGTTASRSSPRKTPVSAPPATGGFPSLRACM